MSYCRWSSDDFQCDVYVYESVAGGFVTHVAANRVVFRMNCLPWFLSSRSTLTSSWRATTR